MNFPSLPKTQRTYETKLWPHKIKYSAFTTGQQSLLLAVADKDASTQERLDTMSQVFTQCVDAGAPFSALPVAVVEKVFLLMREISVGDVLKLKYGCNHKINDSSVCGQELIVPIDLKEVDIRVHEGYKNDFNLSGDVWIRMKLPTYGQATQINADMSIQEMLATFTDCLYNEEESWPVADPYEEGISLEEKQARTVKLNEFRDWIADNIDSTMLAQIKESFFDKMPSIGYSTSIKCPKCGTEHPIVFDSLNQIFI